MRRARVVLLDGAVLSEGVEVPAHRCGGQPEEPADLGGGDGSVLGHRRQDALTRALLVRSDKHHTIVT
jgi:hypothetical protein